MSTPPASISPDTLERVRALFDACIDLPPHEREALLRTQPQDAEAERLLQAMLAADAQVGDLFDTPVSVWAAQLDDASDGTDALIGSMLGDFRIAARLGQGGSSVVFDAEREMGGAVQRVALKVLRTGLFSREAQRRFRREQAILAQLTHPNIAALIDAGVSDVGIPYIAMERIDGQTVVEHADARQLDRTARLRLLVTIADAVDAAHRALVVHRDLKPANVLVDREGRVKVLDFGIAKLLDDDATQTQHIALTPGYAAPEQYRPGPITTAVDVYGLGVIGAELLLGARLGPDAALLPGPDAEAVRMRWRALDPDLATLLRTALAEDPLRRYASARHLADDIERHLRREPIAAHPPSWRYLARKFVSRHRLALSLAGMMLALLLGALAVVVAQRNLARQEAARADSLREFMFDAFAEVEPAGPRDAPATVLDVVKRAISASARDEGVDPRARLDLRLRLAQVLQRQGDLEGARELFAEVKAAATRSWGEDDALARDAAVALAQNSMARGEFALSRAQFDALPDDAADPVRRVERLSLSAVLATRVRELDRAQRDGEAALALARTLDDPELLRATLNDWSIVLLAADRLDKAIAVHVELLGLNRARFGQRHQKVANVQAALARAYRRSGDLARAEDAARAAVEIDRAIYAGDDRHAAVNLNALMLVLRERGDLDGALVAAREALRINSAVLGEDHPDTALARYGVGELLVQQERYAEAAPLLARTTADNEREFGADHWRTAAARVAYGYALGMGDEASGGVAELERAIAALRGLPAPDLDRLCSALEKRVRLAQREADIDAAMQWLDRMRSEAPDAAPTSACWTGNVELRRAAVWFQAGKVREALAALDAASPAFAHPAIRPALATEVLVLRAQIARALQASDADAATARAIVSFEALHAASPELRRRRDSLSN
jgi:tetratricopeptide (TPR) repeat protein